METERGSAAKTSDARGAAAVVAHVLVASAFVFVWCAEFKDMVKDGELEQKLKIEF